MQGAPDHAVLDHVAERSLAELPVVEVEEERRVAVGDPDLQDRLGLGRHAAPHADRLEGALGGVGDGAGAAVEGPVQHRSRRGAIDQRHPQPGAGQSAAERQPHQAAADDEHVGAFFARSPARHGANHRQPRAACPVRRGCEIHQGLDIDLFHGGASASLLSAAPHD